MTTTIVDLITKLKQADADLRQARLDESEARSAACAATNKLNEAQRAIDAYLDDLRKGAAGGDWAVRSSRSS